MVASPPDPFVLPWPTVLSLGVTVSEARTIDEPGSVPRIALRVSEPLLPGGSDHHGEEPES